MGLLLWVVGSGYSFAASSPVVSSSTARAGNTGCAEGAWVSPGEPCPVDGQLPVEESDGARGESRPAKSKRAYNLLNPTPRDRLRPMSTDRPDQTESPYTVDAGHFQLEMDFVTAAFTRRASMRTEERSIAPVNLKLGLLNNVDLQFVLDPYSYSRVNDRAAGSVATAAGFGDTTTRVKINLWGNDGGRTAFGAMPFVKWPLPVSELRNGRTEGGIIFPLAVELADGWDLGAQTALGFVRNPSNDGYDTEFVNSVTVGHGLSATVGMYVEFFTVTRARSDLEWQGQVDLGGTYALGENLQLDAGCNFGVTDSAPDFNPFAGLSWRF